jgi:Alpha-kinase family
MSSDGQRILQNPSFLATSLLHHNPARGDAAFIRITGNDPSVPQSNSMPLAQTLNAFAHFAYAYTGGTHLLVDFQGEKLLHR